MSRPAECGHEAMRFDGFCQSCRRQLHGLPVEQSAEWVTDACMGDHVNAPVSSPTPDEQAAETRRTCQTCGAPTYAHGSDCRAVLLAQGSEMAEVVDLRAALVVVREQLTQARRVCEMWAKDSAVLEAASYDEESFLAADVQRRCAHVILGILSAPPSPPTYTTEEPN